MKQKKPTNDARLEGYDPVPVPVLDSTIANTDILARITLTFLQTLSLSRLEESWYALVRAWPILAARVRSTPCTPSGISYLIPQPSTLSALETRSRTTSKEAEKHLVLVDASFRSISTYQPIVGKALNGSLSRTQISVGHAPARAEQDDMTCANACKTFKELLEADQSFLTAQATRWADATVVTIAFSHIAGDAFGIKSIFAGWADALRGQVPAGLEGLGKDPYIEYAPPQGKKAKDENGKQVGLGKGWKKFGFVETVRLISNLLWDIKVKRPEKSIEQFYIYMPEEKVQQLITQAKQDLEQLAAAQDACNSSSEHGGHLEKQPTPPLDYTVSTFNILFAFLLQNIHAANPSPRKRSSVLTIINAKHRPPAGHSPSDYPSHQLWGGAFGVPLRPLSSGEYANLPLGQIALHIRESLKEQIDPENIRANIVTSLKHGLWKNPSGKVLFFAGPRDYWYGCTEWRSVRFNAIDFRGALEPGEKETGGGEGNQVRPVAIGTHMEIPMTQRNRWVIFGDAGKGVWFSGGMTRKEVHNAKGFGRYEWVQ
ncbi:Acetyltransferase involved in MEL production [Ustilago bromivora]|uniref:Acetyltransferase involved in MEL production n=1 Tax=Ustilago bromivora TaxID=307758 RepID=A0A1K0H3X3_9BASI|nr:Acetyltransferase involved in MEL production [Ustilago bromivora]SYW78113.1 Acetyltransferase involved in MEL production [Ustilago bromivora]